MPLVSLAWASLVATHGWPGTETALAQTASAAEAAARSGDESTLARIVELGLLAEWVGREEFLDAPLERVLALEAVPPLAAARARWIRAGRRRASGRADAAEDLTTLGLVLSGTLGAHHAGQRIERSIRDLVPDGVIRVSRILDVSDELTAELVFGARLESDADVVLRVGSNTPLKVVAGDVDSILVARPRAELDQHATLLGLKRGFNSVRLIATGRDIEVIARLTAPDGSALSGLTISDVDDLAEATPRGALAAPSSAQINDELKRSRSMTGSMTGQRRSGSSSGRPVVTPESFLRAGASSAGASRLRALLLHALGSEGFEGAFETAIAAHPDDVRTRLARAFLTSIPARATQDVRAIMMLDPSNALAELRRGQLASNANKPVAALASFDRAVSLDPRLHSAVAARAELLETSPVARRAVLNELLGNPRLFGSALLLERAASLSFAEGSYDRAAKLARAALELDGTRWLARSIATSCAIALADGAALTALLAEDSKQRPWSPEVALRFARRVAGEFSDQGIEAVGELVRRFPRSAEAHVFAGDQLVRAGRDADAMAAYSRALELDPEAQSARRSIDAIEGRPISSWPPLELERLSATLPSHPEQGSTILLDESIMEVLGPRRARTHRRVVFRYDQNEPNAELSFGHATHSHLEIRRAELTRNEKTEPIRTIDEARSSTFDERASKSLRFDASSGDVVVVELYETSTLPEYLGPLFARITDLSDHRTKYNFSHEVVAPASMGLRTLSIGIAPPEIRRDSASVRIRWTAARLAGRPAVPFEPPPTELHAMVGVSTFESWDQVGAWFAPMYEQRIRGDDEALRQTAERLARGRFSDDDRLASIFEFVASSIRYVAVELGDHAFEPARAADVLRRRSGDCKDKAVLLVALLDRVGLKANVALIRTYSRGRLPPEFVTPFAFDHAIVWVPSIDRFVDPTIPLAGLGELPLEDRGVAALVLGLDGTAQLRRTEDARVEHNTSTSEYHAKLTLAGKLIIDGTEAITGDRAAVLRAELSGPDFVSRLERLVRNDFPGAKVLSAVAEVSDPNRPARYRIRAELPQSSGDELPAALFPFRLTERFAPSPDREVGMLIRGPWTATNDVTYELPPNVIFELPKAESIETPFASLNQWIEPTATGFRVKETVSLLVRGVAPTELSAFRDALRAIDSALERKVKLSK
ncbi:MAG: hypothetical protein HY791_01585 [Deltaproteobacteria bacterium]|nr:hypothetical protein [Deltaproteobacteria bacterium]